MDHYIDIKILPDLEITAPVLMNNLFAKFHRAMSSSCNGDIAASFPNHNGLLGDTLRLHGTRLHLEQLMSLSWMKGLRDYTQIEKGISLLPEEILGHRTVSRVQKKSPRNIRNRSIAKGWLTEEEALARYPDHNQEKSDLPYLQIKSLSNQNMMRIYVQHGDIVETATLGRYSSYGFSRHATIPWF